MFKTSQDIRKVLNYLLLFTINLMIAVFGAVYQIATDGRVSTTLFHNIARVLSGAIIYIYMLFVYLAERFSNMFFHTKDPVEDGTVYFALIVLNLLAVTALQILIYRLVKRVWMPGRSN